MLKLMDSATSLPHNGFLSDAHRFMTDNSSHTFLTMEWFYYLKACVLVCGNAAGSREGLFEKSGCCVQGLVFTLEFRAVQLGSQKSFIETHFKISGPETRDICTASCHQL